MLQKYLLKNLSTALMFGFMFTLPTWAMDYDERLNSPALVSQKPFSNSKEEQSQGIHFPLHKIQTTEGLFYLLSTQHNVPGNLIPKGVWSIVNQCDYGIEEFFAEDQDVKLFKKPGDILVKDYINNVLTNPNHGIIINEKVIEFFKTVKKSLEDKGYYTNPYITEDPSLKSTKLALDLISDIANGLSWSEKRWGKKLILGTKSEWNPLLFTSFGGYGACLDNAYLKATFTNNYDGGLDDSIAEAFVKNKKPIYGLEGFLADFPKEVLQDPLEKLAQLTTQMFKVEADSILSELSALDELKNIIEANHKTAGELLLEYEDEASFSVDYFTQDEGFIFRDNIWIPRLPLLVGLHPGKIPLIYVGKAHAMDILKKLEDQKILGEVLSIHRYHEREGEIWELFKWENVWNFKKEDQGKDD